LIAMSTMDATGQPSVEELIEALSLPRAYPHPAPEVELVQTHVSLVFLAGDRAYKVKKPVDLGFLDFTTPERRRQACEDELRLNETLAPGVYRGLVPITREEDGSLRVGGSGTPVELAVEMRRLPARRMLDRLLDAGEVDNELMGRLADLLVRFHAEAATGPGVDDLGSPEAVAFNVRENFLQTERFTAPGAPRTVSPRLHGFLRGRAEAFLADERALLERRVRGGFVRDGHGDLHAGNVCVEEDGILVYDRIEFAPRFRCGDVACDLAFLAMDLDARGFRGFSSFLAHRYAERSDDPELRAVLGFYKTYRAVVRAKVASLAAADPSLAPGERAAKRLAAMRSFHLAAAYELPPALVLTCGLPAAGKTTAARAVAAPFEALVLRSDVRRKRLAGLAPTSHAAAPFGEGIYAPELSERTYRALLADAEVALRDGRTTIVDATFAGAAQRAPFAELARSLGAPFLIAWVTVPEGVAVRRLAARAEDPHEASDADVAVYRGMHEVFQPPSEIPAPRLVELDGTAAVEEIVAVAIDALVGQAEETVGAGGG
jgi:aminoglycoside phosphotransferase family enzyme/predicted kinase